MNGSAPEPGSADLERWVREDLHLADTSVVTVSERACTKPGCAPVETIVDVAPEGEDPFLIRLTKPVAKVERMDLIAALAFGDDHG